jgi:hypothetical protein
VFAVGGAVLALAIRNGAIDRDEHGEVRAIAERVRNRSAVRGESIGRDLKLAIGRDGIADAFHKNIRGPLVELAQQI